MMNWTQFLPRQYYEKYEKVPVKSTWFEVYRLPNEVYAITEPFHFQEVNSYLIIGEKKALLFDTGLGIANIEKVCRDIYPGHIFVVNSHLHFDHIGDNHRFDEVYSFNESHALKRIKRGLEPRELAYHVTPAMFAKPYPKDFCPASYRILPSCPGPIEAGHLFELGGRSIEVLHTPGHTADSIMLLDRKARILFTGDTFYLGALYAHFNDDFYGYSSFPQYCETLERLTGLKDNIEWLYCSHNDMMVPSEMLLQVHKAFRDIKGKRRPASQGKAGLHTYENDEKKLLQYQFDGFSVIVRCSD